MAKAKKKNREERREEVNERMAEAIKLSALVFGDRTTTSAENEIFDYLENVDEVTLLEDLKEVIEDLKSIRNGVDPAPEQVFAVLYARFVESEDDID